MSTLKVMDRPFSRKCERCDDVIRGESKWGLNRNMGVHLRVKHGQRGTYRIKREHQPWFNVAHPDPPPVGKVLAEAFSTPTPTQLGELSDEVLGSHAMSRSKSRALNPAQKKRRAWLLRQQWLQTPKGQESRNISNSKRNGTVEQPQTQAVPCKLSECPECGARFYVMKGHI